MSLMKLMAKILQQLIYSISFLSLRKHKDRPSRVKSDLKLLKNTTYMSDYPLMKTRGNYSNSFPVGAVIHMTAGSESFGEQSVKYAIDQGHCYFVIDKQGEIYQQFSIDKWGSHAGKSYHPILGKNLSNKLVGIEIQNPGKLEKVDKFDPKTWWGKRINNARYFNFDYNINEGWYQVINDYQINALKSLIVELKMTNPRVFDIDNVLGHDEISKGRKSDPGGALGMSMVDFREDIKDLFSLNLV